MLTGGPQGAEFGCKFCGFVVVSELNEPEIPAPKNVIILLREREREREREARLLKMWMDLVEC